MERAGLGQLKNVRLVVLLVGLFNVAIFVTGGIVAVGAFHAECPPNIIRASLAMAVFSAMRVMWMLGMGIAQSVTAATMIAVEDSKTTRPPNDDSCSRRQRRRWYTLWLWWSRLGITMTFLQVMSACYITLALARSFSSNGHHLTFCANEGILAKRWFVGLMVVLPTLGSIIVVAQCCVGSDVLSWRLLYGSHYGAWRAHYRQMFDHGIREVLCCLGRRRYLSVLEEDEVDSVAALLGDLVAYRAAGASHLEVLAGVALLKEGAPAAYLDDELSVAPDPLIREATVLHPYAVAAYTGPLLDVGRNPFTFPCAWLFRQGVLTPWKRNRMPKLEGDNWWRGHAAAFLRFAQLPPEALRQGRVLQTKRESVYFVVVLDLLRCVVVAVRGTETPEDLLTDGLGRESALTNSDLCGILKNPNIPERVKQQVLSSMPHFGHIGVIEAARELALELDNLSDADYEDNVLNAATSSASGSSNNTSNHRSTSRGYQASLLTKKKGLLTSLLGPSGECEGYSLRIVGHSLGGAIAALTGLRLANKYPNLHVYTFGVLPCVDLITAESCESFVTSVIYNDEFSSRLSVAAIMRLRAAALQALAMDSNTDSALVSRLTRKLFKTASKDSSNGKKDDPSQRRARRLSSAIKGGAFLCAHACRCVVQMPRHSSASTLNGMQHFYEYRDSVQYDEHRESIEEHTLIQKLKVNCKDASRTFMGIMDNGDRIGFPPVQSPKDKTDAKGVSCALADGEDVVLGAGGDIYDEDETEDLIECSGSGRQENDFGVDGAEDARNTMELLDNGMPRHLTGLGTGVDLQEMWPAEMYVPGLVIHLVRNSGDSSWSALRRSFAFTKDPHMPKRPKHKAYLKDRKQFRDILVSPAMFLDHMPWKCQYALNDILEQLNAARQRQIVSSPASSAV